ncbi:MAG: hypothetical protein JRM93_04445 [Nitrososphaerota archaeon]|nr:MAG: hypothetical protein JRM93_04445 [Nitrososphaerota archaeon]
MHDATVSGVCGAEVEELEELLEETEWVLDDEVEVDEVDDVEVVEVVVFEGDVVRTK